MSRRAEGQLFIGRLSKSTRTRDLEEIFEQYGRMVRCEIKYGAEMAYGFVDYEDRRDAEDALKYENGRDVCGSSIIVEWAKGGPRRPVVSRVSKGHDECYKCHRVGHWARDCPDDNRSYGYRRQRKSSRRSRSRDRHSRSRSRSRDRRRRSRSRSRDRRRSRSKDGRRAKRSPSRSISRSRSRSMDRDRKGFSRSRSISPRRDGNGMDRNNAHSPSRSKSRSRSRSRSKSKA